MNTLLRLVLILISLFSVICGLIYLFQEKLIFFPEKLDNDFKFSFNQPFEEVNIKTGEGVVLNGVLFKAKSAQGVIFYLHGNAGSLRSWGEVARTYTDLNYDVFMIDYRGYGKSEGRINNQEQFYLDLQTVYDQLKTKYDESRIIVLGYSIGTGPAAKIACDNHPRLLILQAPYYSLTDMMKHYYPVIPTFILKYKFETNQFIQGCTMPVIIFHGNQDEVVYYNSSVRLKSHMKDSDTLITLNGQGHNGISDHPDYRKALQKILNQ